MSGTHFVKLTHSGGTSTRSSREIMTADWAVYHPIEAPDIFDPDKDKSSSTATGL